MIVYDVVTKVLDTESFPQHNIAGLISGITFVLFSQEKPLRWKEIHTHTQTVIVNYKNRQISSAIILKSKILTDL